MKRTDGSTGFRISTLEDAPGVTWVAGDEQTVFLPGTRHFQCPLPSELLWLEASISSSFRGARHFQCPLPSESVWRQFCTARLLVCISCVCFVSLSVYFCFPLPPYQAPSLAALGAGATRSERVVGLGGDLPARSVPLPLGGRAVMLQ